VRRPLSYFAPETRFAVGDVLTAGLQLKTLVKTLHEQGIEVLLEVRGPTSMGCMVYSMSTVRLLAAGYPVTCHQVLCLVCWCTSGGAGAFVCHRPLWCLISSLLHPPHICHELQHTQLLAVVQLPPRPTQTAIP
jgi:hypothetical protein